MLIHMSISSASSFDHAVLPLEYSIQKEYYLPLLLSLRGGMQISVKTLANKTITSGVKLVDGRTHSDYSIHKEYVLPLLLDLRGGMQISMKTLAGIQKECYLPLLINQREGMQISVKTLAARAITSDVELMDGRTFPDHSIQKECIQPLLLSMREGMQIYAKILADKTITLDVELVDARTLSDYSAQGKYFLPLLLSLRGGMQLSVKILPDNTITPDVAWMNGRTLSDSGIQKEYVVSLLLSLRGGMQISVETMADKSITAEKTLTDKTINSDVEVLDGRTLTDHSIQQEYSLPLLLSLHGGMQLYVQTLAGMTSTFEIVALDTIDSIQAKTPDKKGILTIWQRLILASKQFGDDHTSSGHDTQKESILHLVLRLCGGMTLFVNTLPGKTSDIFEPCPVIEFQTNLVPNPRIPTM